MAQKTVVTVVCDLPHDGEIAGNETVSFAFDGTSYEIDVCSAHAKELQDSFGPYAENGRRIGAAIPDRNGVDAGEIVPVEQLGEELANPGEARPREIRNDISGARQDAHIRECGRSGAR